MLGVALVAFLLEFVVGSIGMSIIQQIVGETVNNEEAMESFVPNALRAFFQLLAGAGIAEETTFRLVCISLVWRLSGRRWPAIIVSAVLFGAYGYVYVKRGFETVVLAHTLSDWLPFLIFAS
jgi:membrane protease YdiL (CAAX protease family)